jgi:hypothetical protein
MCRHVDIFQRMELSPGVRSRAFLLGAIVLMAFLMSAASARATPEYTLLGNITAPGSPGAGVQGTQVTVTDSSTGQLVASASTDMAGFYRLTFHAGVYDIVFTPPFGSGYPAVSASAFKMVQSATLSIVLGGATSIYDWSGVARGAGGAPVPGMEPFTEGGGVRSSTMAGNDGSFSLPVAGGEDLLKLNLGSNLPAIVPKTLRLVGTLRVAGDIHEDINLSLHLLTITFQGPHGEPLSGVEMSFSVNGITDSINSAGVITSGEAMTFLASDAQGKIVMALPDVFRSTEIEFAPPPSATNLGRPLITIEGSTSDQSLVVVFPALDTVPPTISCDTPDAAWHASNIAVACTASDSGSGLANPADEAFVLSTAVSAGSETANASTDSRRVCDRAEECSVAGPYAGLKVDRAAPTISIASPSGDPTVLQGHSLDAEFACSDGGSGVASCSGSTAEGQALDTTTLGLHTLSVTTTDEVGNSTTSTASYTVVADPTLRVSIEQAPDGQNGWFVHVPALVTAHATGTAVNLLSCTLDKKAVLAATEPTPEGLDEPISIAKAGRHTVVCSASDAAADAASSTASVLIDLTPPQSPTAQADRPADFAGRGGWYRDSVTVSYTARTDPGLPGGTPGSGIDPASLTAPQLFTTSGVHATSGTVADLAGNTSAPGKLTVRVDADPPTSTLTCPTDPVLGSSTNATWHDADGESGLLGTGTGHVALDTSTLGTFTVTHTATDSVGFSTTSSCEYRVLYKYTLSGLGAPPKLNVVKNPRPTTNVTFGLNGDQGLLVFALAQPQQQPIDCVSGEPTGAPTEALASAPLSYSASNEKYTFHWSTIGIPVGTCVQLSLGLLDGSDHEIWFSV